MITSFLAMIRIAIAGQQVECVFVIVFTYLVIPQSSFLEWPELDNESVNCVRAIQIVFSYLVIPQSRFIWTIRFATAGAGGMLGSHTWHHHSYSTLNPCTFYLIIK